MSDDLVKRLRDAHSFMGDPLLKEAADEIERLREALERCADVTEKWPYNLARQVNEIARAALTDKGEVHLGFNEPNPHTPRYPRSLCPVEPCTCAGEWTCDSGTLAMVTR